MINKIFILLFLFLFSCQTEELSNNPLVSEIQLLKSDAEKQTYLEEIFKEDQSFRQGQASEIIQAYGKKSPQYQKFMATFDQTDSLNLLKVEHFIKHFGYPKYKNLGEIAAQTPWVVIHHARSFETRVKHFKTLHKAYEDGNIDGSAFSLFLERMYNLKFRQRYVVEGVYNEQNKIDSLIQLLELNDK